MRKKYFLDGILIAFFSATTFAGFELRNPDKNNQCFTTDRLIAKPCSLECMEALKEAINAERADGTFNYRFYENEEAKGSDWPARRCGAILPRIEKNILGWRFFYDKTRPERFVCFIGGYKHSDERVELAWATHPDYQNQHYTSEAIRAFIVADVMRLPDFSCLHADIHPDNRGSADFAEHVLKMKKVGEHISYGDKSRDEYQVSHEELLRLIETWEAEEKVTVCWPDFS